MHFGGIRKTSLIDYPGSVSCTVFALGCNFHCPYCHNPDLAVGKAPQGVLEEQDVYAFLEQRQGLLDGVVLSGGEPTLQEDLPDVCRRIRDMGFSVKLDTNGSRPRLLESVLETGLVDYVAMDLKTDPLRYFPSLWSGAEPDDIFESIRMLMTSSVDYEFRTTCVKPFVDESLVDRMSQVIEGARLYALQPFQPEPLLNPSFFEKTQPGFDAEGMARLMAIASPRVLSCVIR